MRHFMNFITSGIDGNSCSRMMRRTSSRLWSAQPHTGFAFASAGR